MTTSGYSKRFAAWVIELKIKAPEFFVSTRLWLTTLYFLVGLFIVLGSAFIMDPLIERSINVNLIKNVNDPAMANAISAAISKSFLSIIWWIRLGILILLFFVSYILATITIGPIEQAFNAQRRFVHNATHELKTPLAVLKSIIEITLMREKNLTKGEIIKSMESGLEEVNRIDRILKVLLSFASFEKGAEKLLLSRMNLHDAANKAVNLIQPLAEKKKIQLIFSGENPVMIRGNPTALEELIMNLIKNAIIYTPEEGSVKVSVGTEDKNIALLVIKDSGLGIPKEDLVNIFEPFYRASNAAYLAKSSESSGLGLSIVKEIARIHRAEIAVRSQLRQGTTFLVKFAKI